jgi:hypothetical protein
MVVFNVTILAKVLKNLFRSAELELEGKHTSAQQENVELIHLPYRFWKGKQINKEN